MLSEAKYKAKHGKGLKILTPKQMLQRLPIAIPNNLETVTNENDKEIPKERYISPEKRQKIIDNLRSIIIV